MVMMWTRLYEGNPPVIVGFPSVEVSPLTLTNIQSTIFAWCFKHAILEHIPFGVYEHVCACQNRRTEIWWSLGLCEGGYMK